MSEIFKKWRPSLQAEALIGAIREVLSGDLSGYRVTLRQLYYQLVTRNLIPNSDRAYASLSNMLTRARLAGLIGWGQIEDRARQPQKHPEFTDLADLIEAAAQSYRLDRWEGQDCYAELWVEKDALASVLRPLADRFHVVLMVNRGYSSITAMKNAADRFGAQDRERILFYLGDLDPSGEDMVRDIRERLELFYVPVDVRKIALTPAQVKCYSPPPNPAKLTDPRAAGFIAKHGDSSWEVDALNPRVLTKIIEDAFDKIIDHAKMQEVIEQEAADISKLRSVTDE